MGFEHIRVCIAKRDQPDTVHLFKCIDVALTPASHSYDGDPNILVGTCDLGPRAGRPA